jgi:hypothetical protein
LIENFSTTFGELYPPDFKPASHAIIAALYFVGGVRVTFSTGIAAGGNLAYW